MAKRTISAKEILKDMRAGLNDSSLMEKYQLSEKSLKAAFKKLVETGAVKQADLDCRWSAHKRTMPEPMKIETRLAPTKKEGLAAPHNQETPRVQASVTSKPENSEQPEVSVCPKCGKEYDDSSTKFCPQDGFKLIPQNSEDTCPKCGCTVEEKTDYCGKCGTRLFHGWDYSAQPKYYRARFDEFERNGGTFKPTWNWAAFLFFCLWYLEKGMWGKALALFLLALSLGFVTVGIAVPLLWLYGGLCGNYDYYLLKKKKTQWW
ncbi:MAG: zinc ribbon domain-containing protein [Pseudomonadota bacterium]